jgi:hypothetical protein
MELQNHSEAAALLGVRRFLDKIHPYLFLNAVAEVDEHTGT